MAYIDCEKCYHGKICQYRRIYHDMVVVCEHWQPTADVVPKSEIEKLEKLQDEFIKRSCTEFNNRTSMLLMSAAKAIGEAIRLLYEEPAAAVAPRVCNIGDKLYCVDEELSPPENIEELTVTEVGIKRIFCSAFVPPQDDIDNEIPIDAIGRTVFFTLEEAKRKLKERVRR